MTNAPDSTVNPSMYNYWKDADRGSSIVVQAIAAKTSRTIVGYAEVLQKEETYILASTGIHATANQDPLSADRIMRDSCTDVSSKYRLR
jgi:hypothetical protein